MDGALAIAAKLADGAKSLALIRRMYWQTWHHAYEQQLIWKRGCERKPAARSTTPRG